MTIVPRRAKHIDVKVFYNYFKLFTGLVLAYGKNFYVTICKILRIIKYETAGIVYQFVYSVFKKKRVVECVWFVTFFMSAMYFSSIIKDPSKYVQSLNEDITNLV